MRGALRVGLVLAACTPLVFLSHTVPALNPVRERSWPVADDDIWYLFLQAALLVSVACSRFSNRARILELQDQALAKGIHSSVCWW